MNSKKNLGQRIRGWFPQEPKLHITIHHTAPPTKTNLKSLNREDMKEIEKSIGLINFGVFFVLGTLWIFALDDSYFYLNVVQNTVILVATFGFCSFLIIFGTLDLKMYKDTISFQGRLKFFEMIPDAIGFALMSIGTFVASFYISYPLPKGVPDFYSWHPYATQGLDLYITGTVVWMATFLVYHYLIPKQMAARLMDTRTSEGNELQS